MTTRTVIDPNDIVGLTEIAELAKVTTAAVTNWRKRHSDFPAPIATISCGSLFDKNEIVAWIDYHRSGGR